MIRLINIYKYTFLLLAVVALSGAHTAYGQEKTDKNLVQMSGIISSEKVGTIPFSTVKIKNTFRGTIAGVDGFYTFVVKPKDTVEFSAVGFKKTFFVVPGDVKDQKLTYSPVLKTDTLTFEESVVYPWPSKEQFRQAFMDLKLDETYMDIAKRNMDQEKLLALYQEMARDGGENQQYVLQQIASSFYYSGGQRNYHMVGGSPIPTTLLNPIAWVQFFKAIKDGEFKKKNNTK
jgi:hypothetical protein